MPSSSSFGFSSERRLAVLYRMTPAHAIRLDPYDFFPEKFFILKYCWITFHLCTYHYDLQHAHFNSPSLVFVTEQIKSFSLRTFSLSPSSAPQLFVMTLSAFWKAPHRKYMCVTRTVVVIGSAKGHKHTVYFLGFFVELVWLSSFIDVISFFVCFGIKFVLTLSDGSRQMWTVHYRCCCCYVCDAEVARLSLCGFRSSTLNAEYLRRPWVTLFLLSVSCVVCITALFQ